MSLKFKHLTKEFLTEVRNIKRQNPITNKNVINRFQMYFFDD